MKKQTILVLTIVLVASIVPVCEAAPGEWVRQSDSPVLDTGGPPLMKATMFGIPLS